jgi:hypothetical protein
MKHLQNSRISENLIFNHISFICVIFVEKNSECNLFINRCLTFLVKILS